MPVPVPDLTHRLSPGELPELMDEPCSYETFRDTVRDLAQLNRLLLAYQPALAFLRSALLDRTSSRPVHVLDVGSGAGDTLRKISRWAYRHHQPVHLTGIDLNPHGTRAAAELSASRLLFRSIDWLTGDVFTHPATQTPDLVLSSLVTHHMEDGEIIRFLRWMEDHASLGWFVSDLLRSPRSYAIYGPLSRAMRWHPHVQHDGLVSIRRAFREPDWHHLIEGAGIPPNAVQLRRCSIGRLCLARLR